MRVKVYVMVWVSVSEDVGEGMGEVDGVYFVVRVGFRVTLFLCESI